MANRSDIQDRAAKVGDQIRETAGELKQRASETVEDLRSRASDKLDEGREKLGDVQQGLEHFIEQQPMKSVLLAAGLGLLIGILWRRS